MRESGGLRARSREVADPGDLVALARAYGPGRALFYWEHPAGERAMLAVGVVREIRTHGADRFARVGEAAARVLATVAIAEDDRCHLRMVGGFGFADARRADADADAGFPPARFVLPRLLWTREGRRARLTEIWEEGDEPGQFAATTGRGGWEEGAPLRLAVPPLGPEERAAWRARVARAQSLIDAGTARKIVLARRRRIVADAPIDPAVLLRRARVARPGCFTVWVRPAQGPSLVASTPELLVRRVGATVTASALAGSAPRAAERDEDARLAAALRACPKNAREHALVVEAVRDALAALGADVEPAPEPDVLRLPEVQHLSTPVRARLHAPRSVLALGGALHPTPAVCGVPRSVARELIEREEPARGWYTGAVGWMDAAGDGELVVTLRSALVDGCALTIWAGAGIVEGSDADAELAETEAKMRALVAPFLAPVPLATAGTPRASAAAPVS